MKKLLLFALLIPVLTFGQATGGEFTDFISSGSIGSAATTVDIGTIWNFNQSTPGITVSIPNPTSTTGSRNMMFRNGDGSAVGISINPGGYLPVGRGLFLQWDGGQWVAMFQLNLDGSGNLILATPSGSPGTATLRSLVTNDFPNSGIVSGTYRSTTFNSKGIATSGSNPARTSNTVTRSLVTSTSATGFRPSALEDYNLNYSVYAQVTSALIGTNTGDVYLEIAATNSTTPGDWIPISRSGISLSGVISTTGNTQTVSGFIPAGYYARIRTVAGGANSGSAVFTYQLGQENSY